MASCIFLQQHFVAVLFGWQLTEPVPLFHFLPKGPFPILVGNSTGGIDIAASVPMQNELDHLLDLGLMRSVSGAFSHAERSLACQTSAPNTMDSMRGRSLPQP